ncbi:MAG: LemA family protein [Candidatus Pacebacteria bacterium]|nr:LemA family protein [Candidatus Paceibacterota bacterium]
MEVLFIALIAILAICIIWFIAVYNGLVVLKNRVKEAWSDIDVQLKRRYDLIPNLIETVKGYATHESGTFEKVTQARNMAMAASGPENKAKAENALSGALKTLFAVAESYPELKASQNFSELQAELSDTENKIQAARRFYNGNVLEFNNKIEVVPSNIVASICRFVKEKFFEIEEGEKAVPQVKF